jgi:hypothetical protein
MGGIVNKQKIYPLDQLDNILINQPRANTYPEDNARANTDPENNILINQPRANTYPEDNARFNTYPEDNILIDQPQFKLENNLETLDNILINNPNITDDLLKFQQSDQSVIIIIIDFIDSTNMLIKNGTNNFINICIKFNTDILSLIYNYKIIKIYEIVGDSYILTINFPYIVKTKQPASMAINFCKELINVSKEYIHIRIGITYDKIYYGIINNHIRIFGESICLASRLENKAYINHIICCANINSQLIIENNKFKFNIKKIYLKSFNNYICYILNITQK